MYLPDLLEKARGEKGALAHLGERLSGRQEVTGSNPVGSTMEHKDKVEVVVRINGHESSYTLDKDYFAPQRGDIPMTLDGEVEIIHEVRDAISNLDPALIQVLVATASFRGLRALQETSRFEVTKTAEGGYRLRNEETGEEQNL